MKFFASLGFVSGMQVDRGVLPIGGAHPFCVWHRLLRYGGEKEKSGEQSMFPACRRSVPAVYEIR